ncbi:ImmA/IrrE family metallo-endopeptidase [Ligilactobacillus salivarius]|uniref:ImmA/IrrE family metallo-endopeptidase n=1 Tax=Ligilactobacillus salivarius TaxID=1624 RepID=UPI0029674594|nr:ImmA/IrrE family metallo-endopeptidase [Ligilactobacillus salivarius]MDW3023087.1 ImmA/IrrE family metallo-endopeptidase [Ligilactobacillus salivarius]
MRSDIKDYLYNICNKENIRVVWLENLSPYTSPSASFEHRCIVMNPNWHNKFEFTFQLAHEMAHILRGDKTDLFFYNTLHSNKTGIEYETNLVAVRLLVPFYCNDTDIKDINVYDFIERYCIPRYLVDVATDEIIKFFNDRNKNKHYILY